jgi:LacI family transcriptional regulator
MADVAALADVSTATVSRVLTNRPGVGDSTRQRVLDAVERLGYRPNAVARSLRVESTYTLGLVIGDIENPFFTELARAVEDAASAHGYSLILGNADEDAARQERYVDVLLNRRVDGLLVVPAVAQSDAIGLAVRQRAPIVFVDRELPGIDVPVVRSDGHAAMHELVEHLLSLGHRRIALISGPEQASTGMERLAAFRETLGVAGVPLPVAYVRHGDFQEASGETEMAALLALETPPTAVIAADNLMALGALRVIRRYALRIPDDIALASFDDSPWFELLDPPLTAIAQPTKELGALAVTTLLELMDRHSAPSRSLPCRLVARASCGELSWSEKRGS